MVCVGASSQKAQSSGLGMGAGTLFGKVGCVKLSKYKTKIPKRPPNNKQEGGLSTAKSVVWRGSHGSGTLCQDTRSRPSDCGFRWQSGLQSSGVLMLTSLCE